VLQYAFTVLVIPIALSIHETNPLDFLLEIYPILSMFFSGMLYIHVYQKFYNRLMHSSFLRTFKDGQHFFVVVHKSQICKFLGMFRYCKSTPFLGLPICKLQILKFVWLICKSKICKFLRCASLLIANLQIFQHRTKRMKHLFGPFFFMAKPPKIRRQVCLVQFFVEKFELELFKPTFIRRLMQIKYL
jgi:hypothetical protein